MRAPRWWKIGVSLVGVALVASACPGDSNGDNAQQQQQSTLQEVTSRGTLNCGVNNAVPGFGFQDEGGDFQGFDVEFCRVVAAAVLGDADAVEFSPLTTEQRFPAVQGRQVDVLIRNTTWTSSRDGTEGLSFATTTFYDGQGMMVKADSEFESLEDLDGTTICVLSATTTELNLTAQLDAIGVDFEPLSLSSIDDIQPAFIRDQCQAWTSDKSQLAGLRSNWPQRRGGPDGLRILDVTMSKEPLGPVTRDGDSDWFDAVNWAVIATIQAEEFGITSSNVDQIRDTTDNPEIVRFLGLEIESEEGQAPAPFDSGLDLPTDFAYQVIKQVGNYGEIYDRTVGPDTTLGVERGVNEIWTEGGLLYAPPYR